MNNTENLIDLYRRHTKVATVAKSLGQNRSVVLDGLSGSAFSVLLASMGGSANALVCVMNDPDEAAYLYSDLANLLGESRALYFPSSYRRAVKYGHIDPPSTLLRAETLAFLGGKGEEIRKGAAAGNLPARVPVIVTYPSALIERVMNRRTLSDDMYTVRKGEVIGRDFLADLLDNWGFIRRDYVYEPGSYAVRGSIVDVYGYARELPCRIDFFDEEIESIRLFEVESQLSVNSLDEIVLMADPGRGDLSSNFLSLLPEGTVLAFTSYSFIIERLRQIYNEAPTIDDGEGFADLDQMRRCLTPPQDIITGFGAFTQIRLGKNEAGKGMEIVTFHTCPQPLFHKNYDLLIAELYRRRDDQYTIFLSAPANRAERLGEILAERNAAEVNPRPLDLVLHEGFEDSDLRISIFTDHQLFDRYHRYSLKSDKARSGKVTLSLKELNSFLPGDYVVHTDHGVGMFGGLIRTTDTGGTEREVVKLLFRNNDVVFVGLHSLHKLSRYRGAENDSSVTLSKLGSGAWQRIKDRTKKRVKDIARDLIKLYAARRNSPGFKFSADHYLQHELEASFMFEDTPDQERATADVKADMEKACPMDRLICGDVGFGKTEVAVRAAFKAALDGKQTAVLVPTTVLAYQHFETFSARVKDFPVRVDYLSRARSAKEIRALLEQLRAGEIDIIIGTHRLVSADVKFKDLGLLIIDEEQKFGVAVKEKLRKLQVGVDTLTMSATPIPRTLQFSLMGARDLSNINTPPPNRYPVETMNARFSPDLIREAVSFEMSRSGQVYFVHNRIETIENIAEIVRREVPDARVAVGHGRMKPADLEKLLLAFTRHEFDVLVATTIIENGIDVPNANTIIIDNAGRYGLSELHQLRGRVGRSSRKAFCYLITPPLSTLSDESCRRIRAIESFSDLGSGIRIALQDLDIRGAGNALGAEQSGFIAELGYDTYRKVFDEAVSELRVDEFSEIFDRNERNEVSESGEAYVVETQVESDLALSFSAEYVPDDAERILLYRELDELRTDEELAGFRLRMRDRFGDIPSEGEELIRVPALRHLGHMLGFEKVVLRQGRMTIHLVASPESSYYKSPVFGKLLAFATLHNRSVELREQAGRRLVRIAGVTTVAAAVEILRSIRSTPASATEAFA